MDDTPQVNPLFNAANWREQLSTGSINVPPGSRVERASDSEVTVHEVEDIGVDQPAVNFED